MVLEEYSVYRIETAGHLLSDAIVFRCVLRRSFTRITAHNRQLEKRKTRRQFTGLYSHRDNCDQCEQL